MFGGGWLWQTVITQSPEPNEWGLHNQKSRFVQLWSSSSRLSKLCVCLDTISHPQFAFSPSCHPSHATFKNFTRHNSFSSRL